MEAEAEDIRDYLALWAIPGIGSTIARRLISYGGGIKEIFKLKSTDLQRVPGIGQTLSEVITKTDYYQKADETLEFARKFDINIISWFDKRYPERLKQCEDAPLILFTKGQPIDNQLKYLAVVGTRNASQRGQAFCRQLVEEAKNKGAGICIVSGLAYGIDVAAHKAALEFDVPTIGVLGHGLDTIYPSAHRDIAAQMTKKGCLVTEFFQKVFADKNNFVRRNRIIAGLCDATLVVESDIKGGSLITAEIANSYSRDVFALPGRNTDRYSLGCNMLIKSHQAQLIESFADIEYFLGWNTQPKAVQKQLFVELDPESQKIYDALQENDLTIDEICRQTELSMPKVSVLLLSMEMKGLVKTLPGKVYARC